MTDFEGFLARQFAFSRATFGPGERHKWVIEHIRKELEEVEKSHGESSEWVDVCLLALDGLMRRINATLPSPHPVARSCGDCGPNADRQAGAERAAQMA